jgi:hypothetical protein
MENTVNIYKKRALLLIRIGFFADPDPDPAFQVNVDQDPGPNPVPDLILYPDLKR